MIDAFESCIARIHEDYLYRLYIQNNTVRILQYFEQVSEQEARDLQKYTYLYENSNQVGKCYV